MGRSSVWSSRRFFSHAASFHAYPSPPRETTDAVEGGASWSEPYGSAFSCTKSPMRDTTRYLYLSPTFALFTTACHTPVSPMRSSGLASCAHPFQSPITLTRAASGAHTANDTPPGTT